MTASEIETEFVAAFPHSSTRKLIYAGYIQHLDDLLELVSTCEEYIDGSFVSNKNDPGDIDLVVFADATVLDALPIDQQQKFRALTSGQITKGTHKCDAYFCPVYPAGHPFEKDARVKRKYWLGEFGYDRVDRPKGIVHVKAHATESLPTSATASTTIQHGQQS